MIFSYNWLQSFFKKRLPKPEKLAELLTMHSFEVSEVRRRGKDFVLDIDVLSNRGSDCFSHLGIAREISVITNNKFQVPDFKFQEDKKLKAVDSVGVEVKDKKDCLRYTARVITDVKVAPSPEWIKHRLKVCGLRPINNIVDIVNFVMLETGQPLHVFDGEKLDGKKIVVRFARNREKIVALDEEKYDLSDGILVIADDKKPIAIAGIKGGKLPEVDKKTKTIVIESANFDPRVIRRCSKKLNLKTDSSLRFEHGLDPNLTEFAVNRAAGLIHKITGGKIARGLVDIYPKKVLPKRIKLNHLYLTRLLGVKIERKEIKTILTKLCFKIIKEKSPDLIIEVPTRRLDISLPEDLVEEIGRIYGYERIKAVLPVTTLIPPERNLDIFWENFCKDILKETGLSEVYNYSFISEKDAKIFGYLKNTSGTILGLLEVENPVSVEQKYLRPSLIPNLLKNVEKNVKHIDKIRIFEFGKIFRKLSGSSRSDGQARKTIIEKRMLTGLIIGDEFYQLKGVIDLLLNKLGISNVWYDDYRPSPEESKTLIWYSKKCAEIKLGREEIGFLGEISPRILESLKILQKVVIFDIDFEKLQKYCSGQHEYRPISKYPAAIRDLAVLVPQGVKVIEVLNRINIAGGALVRDTELFDIYEGEEIPVGKKNLAFHIIYQAENRTLFSKEIDEIHQKIIKVLEKEPTWQVRK